MILLSVVVLLPNVVKADVPVEIYRTTWTVPGGTISIFVEGIKLTPGKSFFITYDENSLEYIPNSNPAYTVTPEKGKITIAGSTQVVGDAPQYPHLEFKVLKKTAGKVSLTIDSTDESVKDLLWYGVTVEVDIVQNTVVTESSKVEPNKDVAPNQSEKDDDKVTTPEKEDDPIGTGEDEAKDEKVDVIEKTKTKETKDNNLLLYVSIGVSALLAVTLGVVIVKNKKTKKEV